MTLRMTYVPLSEVEGYPGNPKEHDSALIEASVLKFGFKDPIAIDADSGKLVEGHGRVGVLRALKDGGSKPPKHVKLRKKDGEWLVPLMPLTFENEAQARAYMIAHNRAVERGGWDDAALYKFLKGLAEEDLWGAMGFTPEDLLAVGDRSFADGLGDDLPEGDFGDPLGGIVQDGAEAPVDDPMTHPAVKLFLDEEHWNTVTEAAKHARAKFGVSTQGEAIFHICRDWMEREQS